MAVRWPWAGPPEVRESYTNVIQAAQYEDAVGSIGKPQPQDTSTVLACCRLWSAAASSFAVEPAGGPLLDVLASLGWRLGRFGWYGARLDGGQLQTVDRWRRLPSGWYEIEIDRDERPPARAVVAPTDFLLIQLPGGRPPWRSSGAEALAALDRALAVDARKPIGIALGSGLEGALDLSAVTTTLTIRLAGIFPARQRHRERRQAHGGAHRPVSRIAHRRGQPQTGSRFLDLRCLRGADKSAPGLWRGQPRCVAALHGDHWIVAGRVDRTRRAPGAR